VAERSQAGQGLAAVGVERASAQAEAIGAALAETVAVDFRMLNAQVRHQAGTSVAEAPAGLDRGHAEAAVVVGMHGVAAGTSEQFAVGLALPLAAAELAGQVGVFALQAEIGLDLGLALAAAVGKADEAAVAAGLGHRHA